MSRRQPWLAALALPATLVLAAASPAPGFNRASAPPRSNIPQIQPQEIWPRLDAGAVLCKSQDDLVRRARLLADPSDPSPFPMGCRMVREMTAVSVVDRVPPGSTEVKLTASGEIGWTDAYLPSRQPVSGAPAVRFSDAPAPGPGSAPRGPATQGPPAPR